MGISIGYNYLLRARDVEYTQVVTSIGWRNLGARVVGIIIGAVLRTALQSQQSEYALGVLSCWAFSAACVMGFVGGCVRVDACMVFVLALV